MDDSEAGPGPPLARNPRTAHAAAWPCLSSRPTHPLAPFPLTALAAACPRLSARPTHPLKPQPGPRLGGSARLTARLGSRLGPGPAALSPLFLNLFVCPLNPLVRSPPLPLAESPPCRLPHRVSPVVFQARAGANVSAQARVSLAPACTSTASLKMRPHLCNSGLKSPPVSMRRAGYDSCE